MKRILIAELKQETSTFNPERTRYDSFRVDMGNDILTAYRGTQTELSGAMDVFAASGIVEIVPTMAAASVSGGPIQTEALDRLLREMISAIRAAEKVDAAYICLHGAMAGESEFDPEGRLLTEIRRIVGDIPIVVSLDLHAVFTENVLAASDIIVPFHTYPHIDQYETGQRSARNLLQLLDGSVRPTTAKVEIPMLVRGDELITSTGRFGEAIRMCQKIEASPGGLAAGVIIGNAFTDVPALQSNVIVTTDNDLQRARREAESIARFMWENRHVFVAQLKSLSESIRIANESSGLAVFSDAADATASGASGDSNAILKGLLDDSFAGTALVPIVDAQAVAAAFAAGVGGTIETSLGGTLDPDRFTPVPVSAYVKTLSDGNFLYEDGTHGRAGRVAVLKIGRIDVMATERSVYIVGRKVYHAHGLDPRHYDVVVVKSPNGFRTHYESIAAEIVPVDVPGSTSANLKSLPYRNCVRPIFPLDEHAEPDFEIVK